MHRPARSVPQALALVLALMASITPRLTAAQLGHSPEDSAALAPLLTGRVDVEPDTIVHVAPLPGDDGDGSPASPRRDLIRVVAEAEPGTAIHLQPGVYEMSAIRDAFGHASSRMITNHDGEPGHPIVLRTDPGRYVPGSQVAVLDFGYENTGDWSGTALVARNDYWVFERFEMRRVRRRAFSVAGRECTLRELELHHADTDGTDNDALIVMMTSGVVANNVVIDNHLHHVGEIDTATDAVTSFGGVNGGCYYSVTRLSYDSATPAAGHDASRAEWEAALLPADGGVYVVGNHVHDCHYGLGLKNNSRGPYYFWSNYVHDADYGIFSPFRETYVRNNVIHDVGTGVQLGRAHTDGPLQTYLKMTGNGAHSEVAFNTIVRAERGLQFLGGWGTEVHHNLVIDGDEPVAVGRNQFAWWEAGAWPGVRGEYLVGPLDADHPFYSFVPGYAREAPEEYRAMTLTGNCYDTEPVIAAVDFVQPVADITGMTFDRDHVVLDAATRAGLFEDEAAGDFRRRDDGYTCGAWLATAAVPMPDAGVARDAGGGDAGDGGEGGRGVDAGVASDDAGLPDTSGADAGGCGCVVGARRRPTRAAYGGLALSIAALRVVGRRRKSSADEA